MLAKADPSTSAVTAAAAAMMYSKTCPTVAQATAVGASCCLAKAREPFVFVVLLPQWRRISQYCLIGFVKYYSTSRAKAHAMDSLAAAGSER